MMAQRIGVAMDDERWVDFDPQSGSKDDNIAYAHECIERLHGWLCTIDHAVNEPEPGDDPMSWVEVVKQLKLIKEAITTSANHIATYVLSHDEAIQALREVLEIQTGQPTKVLYADENGVLLGIGHSDPVPDNLEGLVDGE